MGDICGDNRFEIIAKAKKNLLESTNIHTSEDEMKVLDSYLFRCWQMGWLERYDKPKEPLDIPTMSTDFAKEHGLPCPEGYIFKDENGNVINAKKIVLEKKENEYPNSYSKCCDILGCPFLYSMNIHRHAKELQSLYMLLICRDAYWKIAGEEMGLGKPWKPDWEENSEKSIITKFRNAVAKFNTKEQYTFAFPTEEMRDAFYENFKELIESVKELL